MDFVPDGWLRSFSEAVELYETTRFGEPLLFGNDRRARRSELHKTEKDGRVFNADEEAELSALDTEYRRIEKITYEREIETRNQLQQKLYADQIKASIQDRETGKLYSVPGHFWASDEAKKIFKPRPGIYPYVTINAFSVAHGPVRICRADVVKAAKPASDPPVSLTSRGAKDRAFKAARDYVLTFKGQAEQPTQIMVREHVEKKEHSVTNADPRDWWKKLREDPETRDLIKGSGRPSKNPENTPK